MPTSFSRPIEYLSPTSKVSMGDGWFEIASLEHFWIARRFEVLCKLAGTVISNAKDLAEFGCGQGLLQKQIENAYNQCVTGFDLNENALKQNLSCHSRIFCYDIFQRNADLRGRFDLIFLFDVLEHIADEDDFLSALLFHLTSQGSVAINVPAGPWAYSSYDVAVGHLRRYTFGNLQNLASRNGLEITTWTYWGMSLVPILAARTIRLLGRRGNNGVIAAGFDPEFNWLNRAMLTLSRCEFIPQRLFGTSLMALMRRC